MASEHTPPSEKKPLTLAEEVGAREARKLAAEKQKPQSVWFGLGMMGMVGWSVAVPMVAGVALGYLVDSQASSGRISWILTGLLLGAALGCLNAWYWIHRQSRNDGPPERRE